MLKKSKWILSVLTLSFIVAGCSSQSEEASTSTEEAVPVPVQVGRVVEGVIDDRAGIAGKFVPDTTAHIAPKVSGKLSQVHVKVGQAVTAGDTLFTLDQVDLQNAVRQAEAAYQVAVANAKQAETGSLEGIDMARNNVVQLENSLKQSQNAVSQAEQAYQDAKTNADRMKQLFEAGAISSMEWENAQSALHNAELALANAKSAVENTRASYENAKNSVGYAEQKTAVEVARASVAQAQTNLENAREQLANATVKAPISGIVSEVNGVAGEMAGPQAPVVTIVDINPIIAKAHLSENEITKVKAGDAVTVEVPALDKRLEATITTISPVMDPQLMAFPMEVSIPNGDLQLKADMIVDISFTGGANQKQSLIVPRKAVFEEQSKSWIYKVEGDTVQKVEVSTGQETSSEIEILSGLNKGDQIVVRGQTLLSDGDMIEIQEQQ